MVQCANHMCAVLLKHRLRKVRDGWWCSCSACFGSFFDTVMQPGHQTIPTSPLDWHPHFFEDVVAFHLLSNVFSRSERMQCGDLDGFSIRTVSSVRPGLSRRSGAPWCPCWCCRCWAAQPARNRQRTDSTRAKVFLLSCEGSHSTTHIPRRNNFTCRRVSSQEPRSTRVFADGEAMARLKTKSLETALRRTKPVVPLANQSRKALLLSAQKIVDADPCLASIPGLHQGLRFFLFVSCNVKCWDFCWVKPASVSSETKVCKVSSDKQTQFDFSHVGSYLLRFVALKFEVSCCQGGLNATVKIVRDCAPINEKPVVAVSEWPKICNVSAITMVHELIHLTSGGLIY